MKILILEGIATSGKTTIKKKLAEILNRKGFSFSVIEEDKTLMPLLDNFDRQVSLDLLKNVIGAALNEDRDFVIFDRLFFTHIFRTKSSIDDFGEIENLIRDNALLIFLKIDEERIPERIANARRQRDPRWNEYVSKKGTVEEVNDYYINQQRILLALLDQTSLKFEIFDTSDMNFDEISKRILR